MAERRMLSKKIVESAKFLKMPSTSQNLYFHLIMNADDDGVVEAYSVMNLVKANEDDLRVLIGKDYVKVLNEDLVTYIIDWQEQNRLRADRKIDSIYKELLLQVCPQVQLLEKKERSDTKKGKKESGRSIDNPRTAQCSVVEDSVEKDRGVENSIDECMYQLGNERITHTEYDDLIRQHPKKNVDEVIHRIINHPYWNCLNREVILKWCEEAEKRISKSKKNSFNDFPQREYDFDELEKLLLNNSLHATERRIADVS